MNKQQVKELALANGFKLKRQPDLEMDLNPYVYEFADALLAKANERVRELEQFQQEIAYRCFLEGLNTEKPREQNAENGTATAINHFAVEVGRYARGTSRSILEQLRKEQE